MNASFDATLRLARRAYERARLRDAAIRALALVVVLGALERSAGTLRTSLWLASMMAFWTFVDWRGGALRAGGIRGVAAGAALVVLPLEWLRPCCLPGMLLGEASCCAVPSHCAIAGVVVGALAAATLPRASRPSIGAFVAMASGAAAVASIRCLTLVAGEIGGLALGLAAGAAAGACVRSLIAARARTHAA